MNKTMMNRRSVLKKLGVLSAGIALWSSCDFSEEPSYQYFFNEQERNFLEDFSNQILPMKDEKIEAKGTRLKFIDKVIEYCYAPEDIELFRKGMMILETQQKENPDTPLDFKALAESEDEAVVLCYETTRALSIEHFTRYEYFMTEQLNFKFLPQGYWACQEV